MKSSDVITICAVIVAVAGAISEPALEIIAPGHGPCASWHDGQ